MRESLFKHVKTRKEREREKDGRNLGFFFQAVKMADQKIDISNIIYCVIYNTMHIGYSTAFWRISAFNVNTLQESNYEKSPNITT